MIKTRRFTLQTLALATVLCLASSAARAASGSWIGGGGADTNWSTAANWSAVPGNITSTTTADTATFNNPLNSGTNGGVSNPVVIDTGTAAGQFRMVGNITFDTANVGAYQIGTNGGNKLLLSNFGAQSTTRAISITTSATSSQIIAAPLGFNAPSSTNGIYTFQNNAPDPLVTLSFTGAITANSSGSRPGVIILNGTNAGLNAISGVVNSPGQGQLAPLLIKRGVGTWVLTGSNLFSGTAMTDTSGNHGIQILDGTLSAQNNSALGVSSTTAAFQIWVGNKSATYVYNAALTNTFTSASGGGTLEVNSSGANGAITLSDGYTVNLFNGGTLRSSGSLAANPTQSGTNFLNSTLKVSSSAALSGTISTVNSGDVFTIGNNANDFTGGASDAVVHTNGPGTIVLTQTNNYVGNLSVDKGTLVISGSLTATGTTSVLTGATLGGGGGFAGNLLVSGTVHPGVISGVPTTLSISGSATFNNGSTFKVTLDGAGGTSGSLAIGGSLSLIGTDQLTFNVLSAPTGQTFTIASYAPLTLTPGGVFVTDNTLPAGYTVIYNDAAGLVQLAPVPEPATWAMLAGSAWMLVAFRRFRRRSLG